MKEYQISKDDLIIYLKKGMSSREIEGLTGVKYWNVVYYIKQYGLTDMNEYKKIKNYQKDYFKKINTKEKAYLLGLFLGDGCISKDNKFDISIQISDKEVLEFAVEQIGGKLNISNRMDKSKKIFPNVTFKICENNICRDLRMLFGGRLKEERHLPRISPKLENYLLLGFFDAEGCITYGKRKDRDRYWQKISFTSQLKMLEGVQDILIKNNISTKIRPKSDGNCYVLEVAKKETVLKLLDCLYKDDSFIVLKRKYSKANALRLELGEFGES